MSSAVDLISLMKALRSGVSFLIREASQPHRHHSGSKIISTHNAIIQNTGYRMSSSIGISSVIPHYLEAADENKSILKLHSIHHHNGREVNFTMKVTDVHSSCLDRQVTERVNIENFQGPILMNRRNEMGGVRVDRMQYRRWGGD